MCTRMGVIKDTTEIIAENVNLLDKKAVYRF
jgi:hypothetical protein